MLDASFLLAISHSIKYTHYQSLLGTSLCQPFGSGHVVYAFTLFAIVHENEKEKEFVTGTNCVDNNHVFLFAQIEKFMLLARAIFET